MSEPNAELASRWSISASAAALHDDALVWDNTVPWRDYGDPDLRARCLPRMRESGHDVVSLTLSGDRDGLAETVHKIAAERHFFRSRPDDYVLVERVEQFAQEHEWRRAYPEINQFEETLVEDGVVLVKFWLHLSKEEQLRRFEERERVPWKHHKLTDEDWRNREKWGEYATAVNDMIGHTSTEYAPWTLVAGDDKYHARVTVLDTVCRALEKALDE